MKPFAEVERAAVQAGFALEPGGEILRGHLGALVIEREPFALELHHLISELTGEQRGGIQVVGNAGRQRLGVREHVSVARLEPGDLITAFEVKGAHAAPGRPAKGSRGH